MIGDGYYVDLTFYKTCVSCGNIRPYGEGYTDFSSQLDTNCQTCIQRLKESIILSAREAEQTITDQRAAQVAAGVLRLPPVLDEDTAK